MATRTDPALVRQLRLARSWSQELLAERAGVNLRTIQRLEAGRGASLRTRLRVAAALGVDVAALQPEPADAVHGTRRSVFAGVYALMTVLGLGLVLLDQIYARLLAGSVAAADSAPILSAVADVLLQFAFLTLVAGAIALLAIWPQRRACLLVAASLVAGTLFPLLFVAVVSGVFPSLWQALDAGGAGPLIRFFAHAAAAVLAVWGWLASAGSAGQVPVAATGSAPVS